YLCPGEPFCALLPCAWRGDYALDSLPAIAREGRGRGAHPPVFEACHRARSRDRAPVLEACHCERSRDRARFSKPVIASAAGIEPRSSKPVIASAAGTEPWLRSLSLRAQRSNLATPAARLRSRGAPPLACNPHPSPSCIAARP